jgi:hypothetical protein
MQASSANMSIVEMRMKIGRSGAKKFDSSFYKERGGGDNATPF